MLTRLSGLISFSPYNLNKVSGITLVLPDLYLTNKLKLDKYYNARTRRKFNLSIKDIDNVVYRLIGTIVL